jgi:hypothetical protein
MLMTNNEELLTTLLDNLSVLTADELENGRFAEQATQLFAAREHIMYSLIRTFVVDYKRTGVKRAYKIGDLLSFFPWKKTQLDHYLKLALSYNILSYAKFKYALNLENVLVKRVWNYYFTSASIEHLPSTELLEITSIQKKQNILEKQKQELEKNNNTQIQKTSEFTDFVKEINDIMYDSGYDPKDSLLIFCEKKLNDVLERLQ